MNSTRRTACAFLFCITIAVGGLVCAAARVHPVVCDYFLIGGAADGKWLSEEAMGKLIRGGERYRIYTLTKYLGEGTGGKLSIEAPGDTHAVEIEPLPEQKSHLIAVACDWNALRRVPRVQSTSQKTYLDAVSAILRQKGLSGSKPNITQLLRIDLEGDGQEEVLIAATVARRGYPSDTNSRKGDYSFIAMRKLVKKKVETTVLTGEFHTKSRRFSAPNKYEIPAVLDLNGDRRLEVLVWWEYYEGNGVDVFALKDGKLVEVFGGFSGA